MIEQAFPQQYQLSTSAKAVINELTDPRAISKKHDPEGRQELAGQLVEARSAKQRLDSRIRASLSMTQTHDQRGTTLEEIIIAKQQDIEVRKKALLVRIKGRFGISDKKLEQLASELDALQKTKVDVDGVKSEREQIPNGRELLAAYYEKMEHSPLSNLEKRELLKPEVLSSLSIEEYIKLWKRLNPYFLSHVTRQGFRDHNAMMYHSAGLLEFHNGFVDLTKDGKMLRPPLALDNVRVNDPDSIKAYLGDFVLSAVDEEEALDKLNTLLTFHLASAPLYPDKSAVHFAAQIVADSHYGSETGNEVFFVFPSDFIASQYDYAFNGWEKDFTRRQSEDKWNDVFVWPNDLDDPGISIDAGITFLPANADVDPETGSRYASQLQPDASEMKRTLVNDEKIISAFKAVIFEPQFMELAVRRVSAIGSECKTLEQQLRKTIAQKLIAEGIDQDRVWAICDEFAKNWFIKEWDEELVEKVLRDARAIYRLADNTVSSQEYWESFFDKNPTLRPKHVVYYTGSPTSAIYRFQQEYGIGRADTTATDGNLLGFDDRFVDDMKNDPRANRGYDELKMVATAIVKEHFADKPITSKELPTS
jgi:hypothetical protein